MIDVAGRNRCLKGQLTFQLEASLVAKTVLNIRIGPCYRWARAQTNGKDRKDIREFWSIGRARNYYRGDVLGAVTLQGVRSCT